MSTIANFDAVFDASFDDGKYDDNGFKGKACRVSIREKEIFIKIGNNNEYKQVNYPASELQIKKRTEEKKFLFFKKRLTYLSFILDRGPWKEEIIVTLNSESDADYVIKSVEHFKRKGGL